MNRGWVPPPPARPASQRATGTLWHLLAALLIVVGVGTLLLTAYARWAGLWC